MKEILGECFIFLEEFEKIGKEILKIYSKETFFELKEDKTKVTEADNLSNDMLNKNY